VRAQACGTTTTPSSAAPSAPARTICWALLSTATPSTDRYLNSIPVVVAVVLGGWMRVTGGRWWTGGTVTTCARRRRWGCDLSALLSLIIHYFFLSVCPCLPLPVSLSLLSLFLSPSFSLLLSPCPPPSLSALFLSLLLYSPSLLHSHLSLTVLFICLSVCLSVYLSALPAGQRVLALLSNGRRPDHQLELRPGLLRGPPGHIPRSSLPPFTSAIQPVPR
jgi:hypothetical protein